MLKYKTIPIRNSRRVHKCHSSVSCNRAELKRVFIMSLVASAYLQNTPTQRAIFHHERGIRLLAASLKHNNHFGKCEVVVEMRVRSARLKWNRNAWLAMQRRMPSVFGRSAL